MIKKFLVLLLLPFIAFAAPILQPNKPELQTSTSPWQGSRVQLGFVQNTGNTTGTNLNGEIDVIYKRNQWAFNNVFTNQLTTTNGNLTAEQYNLTSDANYFFKPHRFLFGRLGVNVDKFDPYDYTTSEVVGYGFRLLENKMFILDLKLGPGGRQQKETTSHDIEDQKIMYFGGNFLWNINDKISFTQNADVEYGNPNTNVKAVSALISKLNQHLFTQLSYNLDYNSFIPPGSKQRSRYDSTTRISLGYNF